MWLGGILARGSVPKTENELNANTMEKSHEAKLTSSAVATAVTAEAAAASSIGPAHSAMKVLVLHFISGGSSGSIDGIFTIQKETGTLERKMAVLRTTKKAFGYGKGAHHVPAVQCDWYERKSPLWHMHQQQAVLESIYAGLVAHGSILTRYMPPSVMMSLH